MSFMLVGENGYAGDFASNLGMSELDRFVHIYPGLPATKDMFEEGMSFTPEKVKTELMYVLDVAGDKLTKDVKQSIEALVEALGKTEEVAIITQ